MKINIYIRAHHGLVGVKAAFAHPRDDGKVPVPGCCTLPLGKPPHFFKGAPVGFCCFFVKKKSGGRGGN